MTNKIVLTLPLPVSVNAAYSTNFATKKRFKSKKYGEWESEADIAMMTQKKYNITGEEWLSVAYTLFMPIWTKTNKKKIVDAFNYEKTLSDYLSHRITGFCDHRIICGTIKKVHSDKCVVMIEIEECPEIYS